MVLIEQFSYNYDQGISPILAIGDRQSSQISYTRRKAIAIIRAVGFPLQPEGKSHDLPGRNH
jgi:hypothetical protein